MAQVSLDCAETFAGTVGKLWDFKRVYGRDGVLGLCLTLLGTEFFHSADVI